MPRYFFHFHDGHTLPDQEGTELPDFDAARAEAVRVAADAFTRQAETLWSDGEWSLQVTDAAGMTLFALYMTAVQAASMQKRNGKLRC